MTDTWLLGMKEPSKIFKFLILSWTTPYIGVGHLWYLFAMIYVYLLVKIINKFNLYKPSYIFSIVAIVGIYIFELIDSRNGVLVPEIYFRNAFLFGLPYFMLGHMIRKYEDKLKFKDKKLLSLFIISIIVVAVGFYFERKLIKQNICLFASNVLFDLYIFILAINKPNIKFFSKLGELDSGNIYIIHYAIIVILNNYIIMHLQGKITKLLPILVFIASYLISLSYRKIKYFGGKYVRRNKSVMPQ